MVEEIVERLKAEGQLTRNTGTNSIRAVRIQMDKFEAIFETISEQVTLQTKLLADMVETSMDQLRINAETSEREKVRQQREDLADAQEEDRDEPDDAAPARAEREGPGLFSMLSGMGISKLLMGGALLGAGMFAAYNIAKGFVDERTGGGWSAFEETLTSTLSEMDWQGLKNDILSIGTTVKELSIKLAELLGAIIGFIENPWSLFAIGAGVGAFTAGKFATKAALGALFGTSAASAGAAGTFGALGGALGKALGFSLKRLVPGLGFIMPDELGDGTLSGRAAEELAAQGVTPPNEAIRNVSPELYDRLYREYDEKLQAEMDRFSAMAMEVAAAEEGAAAAARTPDEIARLDALQAQNIENDRIAAEIRRSADLLEAANDSIENQGFNFLGMNIRGTNLDDMRESLGDTAADAFGETMSYKANPYNVEIGLEMLRRRVLSGNELTPEESRFIKALREATSGREYKRGTKGFQDFGPASFAILHGREAVVPEETPAGRFLNQFFNEDFSPKMSRANLEEEVSTVASGSVNMPIIVNNSPTVAPIINNVQGGPNINSTSIFGSGGGDRSRNPYGITNGAN